MIEQASRRGLATVFALALSVAVTPQSFGADKSEPRSQVSVAQTISAWLAKPPAWVTWLSLVGGLGTFSWRLYEFWTGRQDRSEDLNRESDAFWYDAIVINHILEPLVEFIQDQTTRFGAIQLVPQAGSGSDPYSAYLQSFQKSYATLIARIRMLSVISPEVHSSLTSRLDELDDAVALICYRHSAELQASSPLPGKPPRALVEELADALVESVNHLKRLHQSLRKPAM